MTDNGGQGIGVWIPLQFVELSKMYLTGSVDI